MSRLIIKRDGTKEQLDVQKIINAVDKAFFSEGQALPQQFKDSLIGYAETIGADITKDYHVEEIQDHIENMLFESGFQSVYKSFVCYRSNHAMFRESKNHDLFNSIINVEKNDVTRENANMNSDTPAGMMMKFASETSKQFAKKYLLSDDVVRALDANIVYPHDLDFYTTRSLTCLQAPLDKVLENGFKNIHGEARPAKRIETATFMACMSLQTTQNEMHGGQAIPAFDFYMAPYVYKSYQEEIDKLAKINPNKNYWDTLRNERVAEYEYKDVSKDGESKSRYKQIAINNTIRRVHQAMESMVHNFNSIHSRGGNQTVFSSINYGTDTSAEGRCVIRELLNSTYRGVGNGATAIFPIQIWKLKKGVSKNPGDPNYDLYKLACKVSARRFFPNFVNLDASFNKNPLWKKSDPKRYMYEIATMGCRTRVYSDRFGETTSVGRGNLSFSTINLVKLAIQVAIESGYLVKSENGYVINPDEKSIKMTEKQRIAEFIKRVQEYGRLTAKQLDERYQFQSKALAKQFPLLMSGLWKGSEKLNPNDEIGDVLKTGTLGIGFIGLAEALVALTGQHHGENDECQKYGLKIIKALKGIADESSDLYDHNYSVIGTPAEGLSGKFTLIDRAEFGLIPGVTERDYYTNSSHVPVYYQCTPAHKAEIEGPYHKLELGGHIFYVEADADVTKNPDAIEDVVNMACENDMGYISVNHIQGRCNKCNYESNDPNLKEGSECPHCHSQGTWDVLARVTGYLSGTLDRWNNGKTHEFHDRVVHLKK